MSYKTTDLISAAALLDYLLMLMYSPFYSSTSTNLLSAPIPHFTTLISFTDAYSIPISYGISYSESKNTWPFIAGVWSPWKHQYVTTLPLLQLDIHSIPLTHWMHGDRSFGYRSNLKFLNMMKCCPQASQLHMNNLKVLCSPWWVAWHISASRSQER